MCLAALSHTARGAESDAFAGLFSLMSERLSYMEDVALYKARNHLPVEDVAREAVVLADADVLARSEGLNAATMQQFFIAQMNAAKAIQFRYRAALLAASPPDRTVDLAEQIRPSLDRLGSDIVRRFAQTLRAGHSLDESHRTEFATFLNSAYLSAADRDSLFDAMMRVRLQP